MQINQDKLNQFLGQMVGELGAAMNAALVLIGDKLGLYKAMAGGGPSTPAELARETNKPERTNDPCANGSRRRLRVVMLPTTPPRKASRCRMNRPLPPRWGTRPPIC